MMEKRFFAMMAIAAALCSCNKEQVTEVFPVFGDGDKNVVLAPLVFTATMEDAPDAKATYDNTYNCASWEKNDRISINGYPFYAGSAGTTTTIVPPATKEVRPTYVHSHSGSNSGESPDKLVDDRGTATKWCAKAEHKIDALDYYAWDIVVKLDAPAKLYAIKLWNGNDTYTYPGRRWKNVKIWGLDADTSVQSREYWQEIKTFENLDLANNKDDLFAGTLLVRATTEYQSYMIDVIDVVDGTVMQMSDMTFLCELNEGSEQTMSIVDAPFHAYFPSYLYDGTTATLPARIDEEWADGKFNMPMYAKSETPALKFKNLCGVLKITVKNDDIASVKSIKVSSANCATSGRFTVNADNAAVLDNPADYYQDLTVTYNTPVQTDAAGKVFYLPIPAQAYRDLVIKISDGEDYRNDRYMATVSGVDFLVERNKIYDIDFADNYQPPLQGTMAATIGGSNVEVPWVQMWEDGPRFAAYNVGVTDGKPESYGGYYVPGGVQDRVDDHYQTTDRNDLPAEHDTATRLWGSNWRMPSLDELQGLIDHCDIERVVVVGSHAGTRFTGRGEYAACTLFLPAAGRCSGGVIYSDYAQDSSEFWGQYWSTTNKLYGSFWGCLILERENTSTGGDMSVLGFSVRAVVK